MSLTFIGCRSELNQLLDSSNLKLSKKQKHDVAEYLSRHIEYTKNRAYQMGKESVVYNKRF